jgi:hypothetical protein
LQDTKLVIRNDGNVGIGTLTPEQNLEISGTLGTLRITDTTPTTGRSYDLQSTPQGLLFVDTTDADVERMRIASNGNVGIGTSAPNNNAGRTTLTLNSATSGGALAFSVADTRSHLLYTDLGTLVNFADGAGTFSWQQGATERMRIDSSGNVGIGTDTPSELLHVAGNILSANTTTAGNIFFGNPSHGVRRGSGIAGVSTNDIEVFTAGEAGAGLAVTNTDVLAARISGNGAIDANGRITGLAGITGGGTTGDTRSFFSATSQYQIGINSPAGTGGYLGSNGVDLLVFSSSGGTTSATITGAGRVTAVTGFTSNAGTNVFVKENPTTYADGQLELRSNAGDVLLGLHASGATATSMRHIRGTNVVQFHGIGQANPADVRGIVNGLAAGAGRLEFVAALPATPDANTIYFIPE